LVLLASVVANPQVAEKARPGNVRKAFSAGGETGTLAGDTAGELNRPGSAERLLGPGPAERLLGGI
jgi:hypothetical protein